jgi:hypothetical protein
MPAILAFFASKIGIYLIVAVIAGGFLIGIRQSGYNSAMRKCEAMAKQREIEIHQRDVKIGELQAKEDARIGGEQSKQEAIDNEVQRKLEAELAKRPVAEQCRLTEPERLRLR